MYSELRKWLLINRIATRAEPSASSSSDSQATPGRILVSSQKLMSKPRSRARDPRCGFSFSSQMPSRWL